MISMLKSAAYVTQVRASLLAYTTLREVSALAMMVRVSFRFVCRVVVEEVDGVALQASLEMNRLLATFLDSCSRVLTENAHAPVGRPRISLRDWWPTRKS